MVNSLVVMAAVLAGIGVIACAGWYLWRQRQRNREEQERSFRTILVQELRKKGVSGFDLSQLVLEHQVSQDIADLAAATIYAACCEKALKDAEINATERRQMDSLQHALAIPAPIADQIETKKRRERYHAEATASLADGRITEQEAAELIRLRECLGISRRAATEVVGQSVADGYLALLRQIAGDGRITAAELHELKRYKDALGLSRDEANELARDVALQLYRRWFYNVLQDGEVTEQEESALAWVRDEFGLQLDTQAYEAQLQEVRRLALYRQGQLPSASTNKILESGQICHWQGRCCFQWETATKRKQAAGDLVITSEQLVFSSPIRSFSISPTKIIDISTHTDALVIATSSSRGTGTYFVDSPRELEAILVGLARRHKYHVSADYSSQMSRHIPDDVRREVWQRDGGCCVRCRAADYLEFDHIIPHSRGGANTVTNVQILCRRCNSLKSDRI
jgi:hypothetical protein